MRISVKQHSNTDNKKIILTNAVYFIDVIYQNLIFFIHNFHS